MMLNGSFDSTRGVFHFGNLEVRPNMPFDVFDKDGLAREGKLKHESDETTKYFTKWQVGDDQFYVLLLFMKNKLREVTMSALLPEEIGGETRSIVMKNAELKRKQKHDQILRRWLGNPPYRFNWGQVYSETDFKSGDSEIGFKFS